MFNQRKLAEIIAAYKTYFPEHWNDEMYKWEAVRHFQQNWDIEAENFSEMFMEATNKTYNLLANLRNYPREMIKRFAQFDAEKTREMFVRLFDESKGLTERIEQFQASAEELRVRYDDGSLRQHYQGGNAVTTYLWLRYPDKYYIYKYSEVRAFARAIESDFVPKKNGAARNVNGQIQLYNEIREVLRQDKDLKRLLAEALTDSCYPDPEMITMTMDMGFFASRFYGKDEKKINNIQDSTVHTSDLAGNDALRIINPETLQSNARVKKWLNPVIVALRELGGSAGVQEVHDKIIELYEISEEELEKRNQSGVPTVINDIDWARNDLNYEGFLDPGAPRGIWTLSPLGEKIVISDQLAGMIVAKWARITTAKRENRPVPQIDLEPYYEYLQDVEEAYIPYTKADFLSQVYVTEEAYETLTALLKYKKNLILQGAPGVGKTFCAKRLAYSMMGKKDDSRVELIQFHQNYSYEDFIMGYKPRKDGFELTNGIFYQFCVKAANHPEQDYFFIIDEINRGNMSKIFGELLMLIEKDYRGTKATLAYSGTSFSVPENLYLIGMMNTADRSLAMIDYALRRRFSFYEMEPGFHSDGFKAYQASLHNETFDALIEQVMDLNRAIVKDDSLGEGFRIGHSYFCGQEQCTEEWMKSVVYYDVIPMLQEYWFDDKQKVQQWENNLSGVFND